MCSCSIFSADSLCSSSYFFNFSISFKCHSSSCFESMRPCSKSWSWFSRFNWISFACCSSVSVSVRNFRIYSSCSESIYLCYLSIYYLNYSAWLSSASLLDERDSSANSSLLCRFFIFVSCSITNFLILLNYSSCYFNSSSRCSITFKLCS